MEENPEVPAATKRDCRAPFPVPLCMERNGKGICPHFEWSGDMSGHPDVCRHLAPVYKLFKDAYDIEVDSAGEEQVILRGCMRDPSFTGLPKKVKVADPHGVVVLAAYHALTDNAQKRVLRKISKLLHSPRFRRKPEPEPRPVPTVRIPLKEV